MGSTAFHGEFSSADASALTEPNSRFTLYPVGGVSALVLGADDFVEVDSVSLAFSSATARMISIYDGADATVDAGETICKASLAQNQFAESRLGGYVCQKGTFPKVKASGAGQVDVLIRGRIRRALP